jgi:hypothetical protein
MTPDQQRKADRGDYYGSWTPARERLARIRELLPLLAERLRVRIAIWLAESGLDLPAARFRRWLYLLCVGMWRGECAHDFSDPLGARDHRLTLLGSGPADAYRDELRIWWERP